MYIYLIIIILLIFSLFISNKYNTLEKPLYFFNISILVLISTFRNINVGVDTVNYYNSFYYLDISNVRGTEYGWFLINYICRYWFDNFRLMLFIVSSLTFVFFTKSIFEYSKNIILSLLIFVLLYYYFNSFNISRQILSCCICLYSLKYINKSIFKFSIWIIIATSIHTSAICMFPIYWLSRLKLSNITFIIIILISYLSSNYLIQILSNLLPSIDTYSMYINDLTLQRSKISLNLLLHTLIVVFICLFNKNNNLFLILFLLGVFISNVFSSQEVIARLALYFKLSLTILIPNLEWKFKIPMIKKIINPFIISLLLFACLTMLINNDSGVCPYIFM